MENYKLKIDENIYSQINTLSKSNDAIECILYVRDFELSKDFFLRYKPEIVKIIYEYPFLNAFGVSIKLDKIDYIAQLSQVVFISSKMHIFAQVSKAKEVLNLNDFYSQNIMGQGINIAVIDTGIAPHIDFLFPLKRIKYFKDFINFKPSIYDDNGHGTTVCGILCGNGIKSAKKHSGIAPKANLIVLKCLNQNGQTNTMEMLNCLQWVYDNKSKFQIDIVCMSFGANPLSQNDPLIKGAETLWDYGITVVAAAGNSGPQYESIKSPGSSHKIITVGSIDDGRKSLQNFTYSHDKIKLADFSSRGPAFGLCKPDILASGVDIIATDKNFNYTAMSGTSASTPIIAGACSLILQKYRKEITPNQIKEILLNNCHSIGLDRNSQGFGYLRF